MIYAAPRPSTDLQGRIDELDQLREALGLRVGQAGPWLGTLRRLVKASSVESSTSIEGFSVSRDEAIAIVSGEETPSRDDDDRMAVACYSQAMDHVGVLADDPAFHWVERVILDLH